jgi:PEP-CTERM motif
MSRLRFFSILVLAVLCVAAVPAFADTVFTDGTMSLGGYTTQGPFLTSGLPGSATVTLSNCNNCGDPNGKALQVTVNFSNAAATDVGLVNNSFNYNPTTQGDITSITASVDKNLTSNATNGSGSTFHPLIEQDGNFYIASITGPGLTGAGTTGYNLLSQTGLLATSFVQYNFATGVTGTANPNFNGDAMSFGLAQITSNVTGTASITLSFDNLAFDIASVPPAKTPEPASFSLLGLGLLGIMTLTGRKMLVNN